MLSNTHRKDLAFVIWSIRELKDIKMLFSVIELHCEINQDYGESPQCLKGSGEPPFSPGEGLPRFSFTGVLP